MYQHQTDVSALKTCSWSFSYYFGFVTCGGNSIIFYWISTPRAQSRSGFIVPTRKTYTKSRPAAPACRASYRSCSLFQKSKLHYDIHVCKLWQGATWISTRCMWAPRVLLARIRVAKKNQVLRADLEAALCLFLVQEHCALARTNENYAW